MVHRATARIEGAASIVESEALSEWLKGLNRRGGLRPVKADAEAEGDDLLVMLDFDSSISVRDIRPWVRAAVDALGIGLEAAGYHLASAIYEAEIDVDLRRAS